MIFIPLPFVVAILLAVLLFQIMREDLDKNFNRNCQLLIGLYIVLSILIGLRWGYDLARLVPVISIVAASWVALPWLTFKWLNQNRRGFELKQDFIHLLPFASVVAMVFLWPNFIDLVLIITFTCYGIALLRLGLAGPDIFSTLNLEDAPVVLRGMRLLAGLLVAYACVDVLISLDIRFGKGHLAEQVVSIANLPMLLILGYATSLAGKGQNKDEITPVKQANRNGDKDISEHATVLTKVEALMHSQSMFRDHNLNLLRIARKVGIPTRQVSGAINKLTGKNVSQYVNDYRIREACELLATTQAQVIDVMLQVGFQTKSNFNREFLRVTGISPAAWRAQKNNTSADV